VRTEEGVPWCGRPRAHAVRRYLIAALVLIIALPALADETGENLVQNPGFEDGIEGWDEREKPIVRDDEVRFTGEFCCKSVGHKDLQYAAFHWVKSADIPAEANREYVFQAMVKASIEDGEISPSVREVDETGTTIRYHVAENLGAGEYDWHQATRRFVSSSRAHHFQIYLIMRNCIGTAWYDDVALHRLRPEPLPEVGTGAAVSFEGSPGSLEMRVEEPVELPTFPAQTMVQATGARFLLRESDDALVIDASQRIGIERESFELRIQPPPGPLQPLRVDDTVVILGNENLEIGFQCDSLLTIAAGREASFAITGKIGGEWTQNVDGNIQVTDDRGGVGVYPYVLPGSGVIYGLAQEPGDLSQPGWTCSYELGEGMLLGLSIYPCRPFDWQKSFEWQLAHTSDYPTDAALETWSRYVKLVTLHEGMWAGEQPTPHTGPYEPLDRGQFRRVIATCERLGLKVIPYMSPYYYVEPEVEDFMAQLAERREEYGFHGIYYDGLYFRDWVKCYRVMRRTRELFPDGPIYLHTSWGPPVGIHDMSCPFVDTYADIVLRGESRETHGPDAPYVDHIASGYCISNAIGLMKGNKWDVPYEEQLRIMLGYNGRARMGVYPGRDADGTLHWPGEDGTLENAWTQVYWPLLQQMREQWEAGELQL